MSKHTPGPWNWLTDDDRHEEDAIPVLAGELNIATVYAGALAGRADLTVDEAEANARLIAAAPEMLGELRRVVDHLASWASDHSEEATTETWAAIHSARAIIAKAESRP